jgi:amidase
MAASVRAAALLLTAMAGHDEADPASIDDPGVAGRDYAKYLDDGGLSGKRIGVVRSLAGFHEGVDEALERAIADMKVQGAEVVDDLAFPDYPEGFQGQAYDLLQYEFKHDLNAWLSSLPGPENQLDLAGLIEFNRTNAAREMKWFRQEIFLKSQDKGGLDSEEYRSIVATVQGFSRQAIDGLLEKHGLDLLVSPSNTPAWMIDPVVGDNWLGSSSSMPARSGYPHITVPMGYVHGLPVGLSFYSTAWSEPVLIEAAHAYERASGRARPPEGFGSWWSPPAPSK